MSYQRPRLSWPLEGAMLGYGLPFELAPVLDLQEPPLPACEVWFDEEPADELVKPAYPLPPLVPAEVAVH